MTESIEPDARRQLTQLSQFTSLSYSSPEEGVVFPPTRDGGRKRRSILWKSLHEKCRSRNPIPVAPTQP